MIRDRLKDEKYFEKTLANENTEIAKFTEAIDKVISERGVDDVGLRSAYNYVCGLHYNKSNILYSSGAPLEEIKKFYTKIIDIMEKSWHEESGYVEMLWMIAIGIMLEVSVEEKTRLEKLILKDELDDGLINFLVKSYNKEWEFDSPEVKFSSPYAYLMKAIQSADHKHSLKYLKEYLVNKWYVGHHDMGWYDSHKVKDDFIYSGYWSFESGAIAKILELDDRSLKDTPYYPYDLVHYQTL